MPQCQSEGNSSFPREVAKGCIAKVGSVIQCDGKLPACTACERSGKAHECTGGSDNFARGKERRFY